MDRVDKAIRDKQTGYRFPCGGRLVSPDPLEEGFCSVCYGKNNKSIPLYCRKLFKKLREKQKKT